jgi:hypothetical protein
MAIVANTYNMKTIPTAGKDFHLSLQSEDVSGAEAILAAESGFSHYITKLNIRADAAMDVSIGSGGDTGTGVTTVHFGPIPLDANTGYWSWKAPRGMGIKCTANLSITIDSTAGGTIWIEAHGKSCQDLL